MDYKQLSLFDDDETEQLTKNKEDFMKSNNKNTQIFNKGIQALEKGLIYEAYDCWVEIDPYEFDYEAWWKVYLLGWKLYKENMDCLFIVEIAFGYACDLASAIAPEKADEFRNIYLNNLKEYEEELSDGK